MTPEAMEANVAEAKRKFPVAYILRRAESGGFTVWERNDNWGTESTLLFAATDLEEVFSFLRSRLGDKSEKVVAALQGANAKTRTFARKDGR